MEPPPSREIDAREAERFKDLARGISSDMSPAAVGRRLRTAGSLYRLARELGRARSLGPGDAFAYGEPERPVGEPGRDGQTHEDR